MTQLHDAAWETYILPTLQSNKLMSVEVLADNGHTTIFHPYQQEATVHANNDVTITITKDTLLQVWWHAQGLWHIPLIDNVTDLATHTITWDCPAPSVAVNSIYELPTTEHMVRYLHAALGFPTKATPLSTAHKGNLARFPGLTVENIFPIWWNTEWSHAPTETSNKITKMPDEDAI